MREAGTRETSPPKGTRAHTGRRRNEAARRAILDATAALLARPGGGEVTIGEIASAAGVGKQTIYRWWPSKGAVVLEAVADRADEIAPVPDTGTLLGDLEIFLVATFGGAGRETVAPLLRAAMAEAQRDPGIAQVMAEFTRRRREAFTEILARGRARGELRDDADLELITDQAYGVLWYRLMVGHAPVDADTARRLARSLAGVQARSPG
ncbi:TetR family transcriptional regulator [Actinomadura sp. NBRC 104412]|uniref:TetR/AcrR family transcriptional regulator n=1 Tax=Actinomadura sp. NBRC 104412 TaxID=3032203 RepID=UPI0024A392FD|nr:TetR/AcrR family transcriptional regulator [Actinomadura sp. NBRC 104412]GLZ05699.1 TetR family transcriptional regulator [Actinomadura sp. NBRC 104412]